MARRLFPRFSRLLRLPALAVLLLAVLANPVFASLGDLHEIGNGAEHLHVVDEHGDDASGHAHDEADPGDLLHALMHASHCCGHLTAIMPTPMRVPAMILPAAVPVLDRVPVVQAPPTSLLRPPIAA